VTTSTERRTAICLDVDGIISTVPLLSIIAAGVDLIDETVAVQAIVNEATLPPKRAIGLQLRILSEVRTEDAKRSLMSIPTNPDIMSIIASKPGRVFGMTALPRIWVEGMSAQLGIPLYATDVQVGKNRMIQVDAIVEGSDVVDELHSSFDQVVAVGSAINDVRLLDAADVAVVFGPDPPKSIRAIADYWVTTGRALCKLLAPL